MARDGIVSKKRNLPSTFVTPFLNGIERNRFNSEFKSRSANGKLYRCNIGKLKGGRDSRRGH